MKLKICLAMFALMMALPLSVPAVAQADGANPVRERQKLMRSVGRAMKTTVKMLRGEIAYDAALAKDSMKTMNDVAGVFTTLFPKGSDKDNSIMDFDKESSAQPAIWADMADFKSKAEALKAASAKAGAAAGDKAALGAALGAVGQACKGCHSKYKAKEE